MENVKATFKTTEEKWDRYLSQSSRLCQAEEFTKIPKVYLSIILGSVVFILLFLNVSGQLISSFIGWFYPAHATLHAIEYPSHELRQQWLTYWVVLGLLQSIEYFEDTILYWMPFYYLFKTAFLLYLMLPSVTGASTLYMLLFQHHGHANKLSPVNKAKQAVKRARSSLRKSSQ
ncbi:TB2/DP1, HVA22 family-domain-containing protein [Absidia repens]|uniref:Protein YOP1 n=1 Tax=Absidia repens TaxID=90262 RepID=A0A1X2I0W4_9FUNG|nr:TB2/DP1, HVA22 family-domain-containing protein [Absidia repens]